MSDNAETQSGPDLDILSQDLSDVSTEMPLLKEALCNLTIAAVEVKPSKDGLKQNLNLTLKTTTDMEAVNGETVNAGFPLYDTVCLTPSEKYSVDMIKRKLASIAKAAGLATIRPFENLVGKVVAVKIRIQKEREDAITGDVYPARNAIKLYIAN